MAEHITQSNQASEFAAYLRSHDLIDVRNDVDRRLQQLTALLSSCYGFGQEWIDTMGSENRDSLMWLASDLAREITNNFDKLTGLESIGKQDPA